MKKKPLLRIRKTLNETVKTKLYEYLSFLSGNGVNKHTHIDLYNSRNLITLLSQRDSDDPEIRALSIFILSQYLLSSDNILEIVKDKAFLRLRQQVFLNNFDAFSNETRKELIDKIMKNQIPSKISERIVLMYYASFHVDDKKGGLIFDPGMISEIKLKTIVKKKKYFEFPDPETSLIWINFRRMEKGNKYTKRKVTLDAINEMTLMPLIKTQNTTLQALFKAIRSIKRQASKRISQRKKRARSFTRSKKEGGEGGGGEAGEGMTEHSIALPKIEERTVSTSKRRTRSLKKVTKRASYSLWNKKGQSTIYMNRKLQKSLIAIQKNKKKRLFGPRLSRPKRSYFKFIKDSSPYEEGEYLERKDVIENCKKTFFMARKRKPRHDRITNDANRSKLLGFEKKKAK